MLKTSEAEICEIPLKPGEAICGGDWGINQDNQSHERFVLVVTDIGQEMFWRRRRSTSACVWTEGNCNFGLKEQQWH